MFTEAISQETAQNLALLRKAGIVNNAYLAGGTALALHLGHRLSYDLDFFTAKQFTTQALLKKLGRIKSYHHERISWGTILGRLGDVKFSLFYYQYPLLKKPIKFQGINAASIEDIAAMKVAAVSERGTKRDFIDLYFILQKFTIADVLNFYEKKYKKLSSNLMHIKKSLVYFADAEGEEMPKMLKVISWPAVKKFFEQEVKRLI